LDVAVLDLIYWLDVCLDTSSVVLFTKKDLSQLAMRLVMQSEIEKV